MIKLDFKKAWGPGVPLVAAIVQTGVFLFFVREIYAIGFNEFGRKIVFSSDYILGEFLSFACTTIFVIWIACLPNWAWPRKIPYMVLAVLFPVPVQPVLGIYFLFDSSMPTSLAREADT